MNSISFPAHRRGLAVLVALVAAVVVAGSAIGATARSAARPRIAYLSFAVANSYDAPMLAAAKSVAKAGGASVTVFDAANDPKKQLTQLQTVIASKQYDGIIVSTLPRPLSRWLLMDLPHRITRLSTVPVTHVEGSAGPSL